jgi:hypothetical protein
MANGPYYPEGAYVGEIMKQGFGETSNGNPQFFITCQVIGYPDKNNPDNLVPFPSNVKSYERTIFRVINEKTIDFAIEDLQQLGFEGTSFRELDPSSPNHQSFVGNMVDLYCKHESYEGKVNERWQLSRPLGSLEVKPLESTKLRQLDTLFGAALREKQRAAGKTPKPATQTLAQTLATGSGTGADIF